MAIRDDFNGPAAPSRPQPGTTNPSRKFSSFRRVRGAAGRPPGERQEGRLRVRCGTPRQTEPQERRTSSSVLGARRGRRCRLDRERGGPGQGRAVAGAASLAAGDDPRGQGGHRETARGLQTSLGKNVLFKGGLQPPRAIQGSRPFSNGTGSPIPCDEGEDLLKGGRSRGISGKAADWRCIHAHFPVKNQVIP